MGGSFFKYQHGIHAKINTNSWIKIAPRDKLQPAFGRITLPFGRTPLRLLKVTIGAKKISLCQRFRTIIISRLSQK